MSLENNLFLAELAQQAAWSYARKFGDQVWWVTAEACGPGVVAELDRQDEYDRTMVRVAAWDYTTGAQTMEAIWADIIDLKPLPDDLTEEDELHLSMMRARILTKVARERGTPVIPYLLSPLSMLGKAYIQLMRGDSISALDLIVEVLAYIAYRLEHPEATPDEVAAAIRSQEA
ncbi:hypothetical protein OG339_48450 (plasmid) [Streptosporangium sp. NBC_01495]|uniref:hypothetical protein n=1 Tax=Streptosporangium sp. NBC_01495 TaxID=2903899 RepID=UPI002E301DA7|nr:hypothetical protein [Streptosporangium sp. NBC_01495]